MNKAQKTLVGLAAFLFVLSCIYPPLDYGNNYRVRYGHGWVWGDRGAIDTARLTLQIIVLAVVAAGLTYMAGKHKRTFAIVAILIGVSIAIFVANRAWSAYQGAQAAKAREAARFVPQDELARIQVTTYPPLPEGYEIVQPAPKRLLTDEEAFGPSPATQPADDHLIDLGPAPKQKLTMFGDPVVSPATQPAKPYSEFTPVHPATKPAHWPGTRAFNRGTWGQYDPLVVTKVDKVDCWIHNGTSRSICAVKLVVRYQDESTKEIGQYEWEYFDRLRVNARPGASTKYSFNFDPPGCDWNINYTLLGITVSAAECPE